jgi:2-keto-4-pentenoate hydratase/2-oxohepta-3-ene-1,7-dioic acid hydratase in catechol pathway
MKIATFKYKCNRQVGIVNIEKKTVQPFALDSGYTYFGGQIILDILADNAPLPPLGVEIPFNEISLEAPLPHPRRNIFCVGKNYLDHVKEVAQSGLGSASNNSSTDAPEYPIIFTKVPESVIACGATIERHHGLTDKLDYEAELAVIIGRGGRNIAPEEALKHVWGYTIINDVSARDLQKQHAQWHIAKSLDTFCPMGPWMVSKDEIDSNDTQISCWVNGELRQNSSTAQMIFSIAQIIASLSAGITLYPGDIIATGTPSGVGMGFTPPRFLQSGDVVKIEIKGIGILENTVGND